MPSLSEILDAIRRQPNRQLAWGRILAGQVIGAKKPEPFKSDEDYVVVRLGSMFLKDSRVLWLKLSPLAHATVAMSGLKAPRSDTAVIGPAQFGDLAGAAADRTLVLNQKLAGPAVWRSGDLAIATGLFAVRKDQAATTLLNTLGQLAALGIPGLKQGIDIANIVKSGVEGLIGLGGAKPVLAVKDTLGDPQTAPAGSEAAPCVLAGIAAPANEIDFAKLWVKDGRLLTGGSAAALEPYEKHDHLLVIIERGPPRQDWRGVPSLVPHEAAFDTAIRTADIKQDALEAKLNEIFSAFDIDLSNEEELTGPDKDRIRGELIAALKERISLKFKGPFGVVKENRSVGGIPRKIDLESFSFLDVTDGGPEGAKPSKKGSLPF